MDIGVADEVSVDRLDSGDTMLTGPGRDQVYGSSLPTFQTIAKPGNAIDTLTKAGVLKETTGRQRDRVYACSEKGRPENHSKSHNHNP